MADATRYNARVGLTIELLVEFKTRDTEELYDPIIDQVEIYNENNELQQIIIADDVTRVSQGLYSVTVGPYSAPATYYDRWKIKGAGDGPSYYEGVEYVFAEGFIIYGLGPIKLDVTPEVVPCTIFILDNTQSPHPPLQNYDLHIMKSNGEYVGTRTTGTQGRADIVVEPEDYVAVLTKENIAFRYNVFEFSAIAQGEQPIQLRNTFTFTTRTFGIAAILPTQQIADYALCTVTGYLAYENGEPAKGIRIHLEGRDIIRNVLGYATQNVGVLDRRIEACVSDASGYVQFRALRGSNVIIFLEGTSIQRMVTIPDEYTYDLMDLVGEGNDVLSIVQVPLDNTLRRAT